MGIPAALCEGGTARCAGWGAEGQLGNGELGVSASRDLFEPVISDASCGAPLTGITAISVGYLHACALLQTGEARCWGNDELGQLGDGAGGRTPSRQAVWAELHAFLVRHELPERSYHALRHHFLTGLMLDGANLLSGLRS